MTKAANTPTVTSEEKAQFQRIASMSGWNIAEHFGCHYSGDCSPIPHGGFFCDVRDWEEYGYASIVEFYVLDGPDSDGDRLYVECGTVHRLEGDKMESAWRCIGMGKDQPMRLSVHAKIEACKAYAGHEPSEDFSGRYVKSFRLADWPSEWRIWRSVAGWIRSLGE